MTNQHNVLDQLPAFNVPPMRDPAIFWRCMQTQWRRAFGLNITQIDDLLFVGGAFRALQWPQLQAHGIRAVLSLQAERFDEFAGTPPMRALRLPVADFHAPAIAQLRKAVAFINAAHADQQPVLIHCHAGIGRASLTASAFLVTQGLSAAAAFRRIHAARPIVYLNAAQRARLLEWEQIYRQTPHHTT